MQHISLVKMNMTVIFSLSQGAISVILQNLHNGSKCPCFAFYDLDYDTAKSPVTTANPPLVFTSQSGKTTLADEYRLYTLFSLRIS